jgi:glycosyltransferase involved in cell wall biosynthesis
MNRLKKGSKILIANDSVGLTGVQTAVKHLTLKLKEKGFEVVIMEPTDKDFLSVTVPLDKQFQWTLFATPIVTKRILDERPDAILISTVEAPIGRATRDVCQFLEGTKFCKRCPFTLMYTTNHLGLYKNINNGKMRELTSSSQIIKDIEDKVLFTVEEKFIRNRFLGAKRILVNAKSSKEKLERIGIKNISVIARGIDHQDFHLPTSENSNPYLEYQWYKEDPKPILLYLGRAGFEKEIHLFLEGSYPDYHRVVAGDGAALKSLKQEFGKDNNIHFIGAVPHDKVPEHFMYARLSAFPSSFDTFGITIIESAACGTPVIGFDVAGPKDVIKRGVMGVVISKDKKLLDGLEEALAIDRVKCSEYTKQNFSWEKSAEGVVENLYPVKWGKTLA